MQNNSRSETGQGIMKPGPSTLISVTNWAAERSFTLVNDLSAAQFVTINVDETVTSNDTCVVISRPGRIQ